MNAQTINFNQTEEQAAASLGLNLDTVMVHMFLDTETAERNFASRVARGWTVAPCTVTSNGVSYFGFVCASKNF